ncbi:MAG: FumA C-terminus/TtdB family hydratase beta subunit [Anaerolineaceae bacterium]
MSESPRRLALPLSDADVLGLAAGQSVLLSGVLVTARDRAHAWLVETFIRETRQPSRDDRKAIEALRPVLRGGVIYHCGPVVAGLDDGDYRFISAGPTTSIREETYQADVLRHFSLKGVIGKGGMGEATLAALQQSPAVYFHAVGGAAVLLASTVQRVLAVHKLDFGAPEALWAIEVRDFPTVVTMDAHGRDLHREIRERSASMLNKNFGVGA